MDRGSIVKEVRERLERGKRVHCDLPEFGRLHIDRPLPFLFVYRQPARRWDEGTEILVTGASSYLVCSGRARERKFVDELIGAVKDAAVAVYGGFLVIEFWANDSQDLGIDDIRTPAFRIMAGPATAASRTCTALKRALSTIRYQRRRADVSVHVARRITPPGLKRLLPGVRRSSGFAVIGVEVEPVYRDLSTRTLFPVLLRLLHRSVSRAVRKAAFEFCCANTRAKPASHTALGPRALVRAVWDADRKLAEISNSFDLLFAVTPVNLDSAWHTFRRRHCDVLPDFFYRPLPVDPGELKRNLYNLDLNRIDDPVLGQLFRERRTELDRQINMLRDRNTSAFMYGGVQLYGRVEPELHSLAVEICSRISPRSREGRRKDRISATEFAALARKEIESFAGDATDLPRVQVRDDVSGILVSHGSLMIGASSSFTRERAPALLQHEVGTHVLTYLNGQAQPLQMLRDGLPQYEELQEGIAVLMEYLAGGFSRRRLRLLAGRVEAARAMLDGATLIDTFRLLHRELGFAQRTAFYIAARVHRGGGFCKDLIYLRGLTRIFAHLQSGGDLTKLFIGKISLRQVALINELLARQVLLPPKFQPRILENEDSRSRLSRVRNGLNIIDLAKPVGRARR